MGDRPVRLDQRIQEERNGNRDNRQRNAFDPYD